MKTVLKNFITHSLYDASAEMLEHLHIKFSPQSKTPIHFGNLYFSATSIQMPKQLAEVMDKVKETFFIGTIDEESLHGHQSSYDLEKPVEGKYQTMMVFAVDIKHGETLTRSEISTLTRGFNRMASSLPVILFVKNGNRLSLATCERSEYHQDWRNGEKLGKVSVLRDINLEHPHRGHQDILESLGDRVYSTFDDLYNHWLEVFSSELLTKKFYKELSEWYAWVIGSGKVKFPNDIRTTEDDMKYNHEAVIRLITRLIFVWFLKQKKLIPEEFFDEDAIREKFIENFDPHDKEHLFYNPNESKYYRLILQNLFFAMLNRPIKDEETGDDGNRRFRIRERHRGGSSNADFNINNLLRYETEFKEGGAKRLLDVANSQIPFLNGGLFECLDHKDSRIKDPEYGMYYDGFTENKVALSQLAFPDYFFFTKDEGIEVDLSGWYDYKKKSNVRGLINILKHYNFTVEENTPLDQEVSLDPELLGKVFENLLASYNPETNTTARKQTGSFYTPRPIVQYMIDESLVTYLKRTCPDIKEETFRSLFDYSDDDFNASEEERKQIISALYACKVLDPACGSGAFPMGILQQMVHALRKLDPSNEMWKEHVKSNAISKLEKAFDVEDEEERKNIIDDIDKSFNTNVNDPDYARKLYLIENCIYGVDIQPIAAQISKLRFFISLVAEQKPTSNPTNNFGIRPLPNLEAKIVAANSLITLGQGNLFTETEEINRLKADLADANHKLFIAKRNIEKRKLKEKIRNIRKQYSDELVAIAAVDDDGAMKLAKWDMFDPNNFAKFFDPEWMFGVSDGFDIIIGNPPYVSTKGISSEDKKNYELEFGFSDDTYNLFTFKGLSLLRNGGTLSYIIPKTFWTTQTKRGMRDLILRNQINYIYDTANPFETVMVDTCIIQVEKRTLTKEHKVRFLDGTEDLVNPVYLQSIPQDVYLNTQNSVIFKPTELNLRIYELYGKKVKELYDKWWPKIETSKKISQNKAELEAYRSSLKPGDIALLGCLTEGGQGLATANNGKYIAVRRSTKWANNIIESRPKKLAEVISKKKVKIREMEGFNDEKDFLSSLTEKEIAQLFDSLKEEYGRDIFGQGYIYKIIDDSEIANVEELTDDEKENGIDVSKNYYVPYDKGDKDGNRWYLETPFAIAWSKENVRFLKTDPKARFQGYTFYFREGFCWIDVNSTYLKARIKANGVFDVLSMSLFSMTQLPDWYFVSLINAELISLYVDNFVNNTSHFQINDARQLPIIIPNIDTFAQIKKIANESVITKKKQLSGELTTIQAEQLLSNLQKELDDIINDLYKI